MLDLQIKYYWIFSNMKNWKVGIFNYRRFIIIIINSYYYNYEYVIANGRWNESATDHHRLAHTVSREFQVMRKNIGILAVWYHFSHSDFLFKNKNLKGDLWWNHSYYWNEKTFMTKLMNYYGIKLNISCICPEILLFPINSYH